MMTRSDYCQFLVSSVKNYTLTYFGEHSPEFSHDQAHRLLKNNKYPPRFVWEKVESQLVLSPNGIIVFDDTVLDKNYSQSIEMVRRQFSGNAKRVIRGIGVVTCVYVNPETQQFWIIDYRIFSPESDGRSKLDHVAEMLQNAHFAKELSFTTVLMDTWYATIALFKQIESYNKIYYCPLKDNRLVSYLDPETEKLTPYQHVSSLTWSEQELHFGRKVHLRGMPKGHTVTVFRLVVSTNRTDYVISNDGSIPTIEETKRVCGLRWKIEQFHRELKQVSGVESCQCRKERIQRNHIACTMLVWIRLKEVAEQTQKSIYQVKWGQLTEYMKQQLRDPLVKFA